MIPALLIKLFNNFLDVGYNALPVFGFHIDAGGAFVQFVRYMFSLNKFLPITTAFIPILLLFGSIYLFAFTKTIVLAVINAVRGAGIRV